MQIIEKDANIAKKILQNKKFLEFIRRHLFKNPKINFDEFIDDIYRKHLGTNLEIKELETVHLGNIKKVIYIVSAVFWHDKFVFDFMKSLDNYSSGFIKITDIKIDRISKNLTLKPSIKTVLTCETFSSN
ncbi:hypothetical protein FACS1894113_2020 [Alphaproteobacteria bacterium]|nr:hypothetical protein FACS1894113_2020 [Alphaproteobacteria bacterium]